MLLKRLSPLSIFTVTLKWSSSFTTFAVTFPVVVADAVEEILPHARIVLKNKGGEGAVREFCDIVWDTRKGLDEVE